MNLDKFFERIYFESLFNRILEDEENNSIFKNQTGKSNLSGNWKDEMQPIKNTFDTNYQFESYTIFRRKCK